VEGLVFTTKAHQLPDGPLLAGVRYHGDRAETNSLILRCETGTRRVIQSEHLIVGELYVV
jgi:fructose-1,6-bisphosphatase II